YAAGVGGRRPRRPGPHLRRDGRPDRDQPVGGEPARRGRRDHRGPAGPRAGRVPHPDCPGRTPMSSEALFYRVVWVAAAIAVLGLVVRRASRIVSVAILVLLGVALLMAFLEADAGHGSGHRWTTVVAGVLAVAGGGQITTLVFSFIDDGER